jgi:quercetin dioxygenase-like cupin family protein
VKIDRSTLRWRSLPGRRSADPLKGIDHGDVSARLVRIDRGADRSPHVHAGIPELIYVVDGTGHFWEDGRIQRVGPGDCIFVAPGIPHATVPDSHSDMELLCLWPHPDGGATTRELDETIQLEGGAED